MGTKRIIEAVSSFVRSILRTRRAEPTVGQLVAFLLDRQADLGGRDDCAMELSRFDDSEAEAALLEVGSDATEDEGLLDSCGESLGEIWARKGRIDIGGFRALQEPARSIAVRMLKRYRPDLLATVSAEH